LAIPVSILAIQHGLYRWGMQYGEGSHIPLLHQAVFYAHLFLGFAYIGAASDKKQNYGRILRVASVLILPRLFISLHSGRFFTAQAVLPILLIALARGWVKISLKSVTVMGIACVAIIFVPALTRGDQLFGVTDSGQYSILKFMESGSTLKYLQSDRDLRSPCPPLLVSLTQRIIPYGLVGLCTIQVGSVKDVPAVVDNLLTREYGANLIVGAGGNYLLELYLTGGVAAIVIGTGIFGLSCRRFVEWIGHRSVFAGIWAECLSRALMAPRGTLGWVYERIPSLLFATVGVILVCQAIAVLREPESHGAELRSAGLV
jgi:hypothetical protein